MDKLRESIISEQTESKGIEELAKNVEIPDESAKLIKDMDKMIKIKKNNIFMIVYQQGKIFRRFKTDNKFISTVSTFEISKTTINFKIDIVKFIEKYPKMQKSCISLYYLKNNSRVIEEDCQEHTSELSWQTFLIILNLRKRAVLVHCKTKV